jgi:glycosyltransferase involved in cell wall biosynthesis
LAKAFRAHKKLKQSPAPKVSVIVPVYNAMPHLGACLTSLINQSLDSYEIILVDDQSDDGSSSLCRIYAEFSDKIKILYQYHAGVSAARNRGLDAARGEYVAFVDADDYLDPDFLEKSYMAAKSYGADLLLAGFVKEDGEKGLSEKIGPPFKPSSHISKEEIKDTLARMHSGQNCNFFWSHLYYKPLIQSNSIRFDEEIAIGEDTLFCMECILKSKHLAAADLAGYHYRIHGASTMRQEYIEDLFPSLQKQFQEKLKLAHEHLTDKIDGFNGDLASHGLEVLFPLVLKNIYKSPKADKKPDLKEFFDSYFLSFCFDHYDLKNSPVKSTDLLLLRFAKRKNLKLIDLLCRQLIFKEKKNKQR